MSRQARRFLQVPACADSKGKAGCKPPGQITPAQLLSKNNRQPPASLGKVCVTVEPNAEHPTFAMAAASLGSSGALALTYSPKDGMDDCLVMGSRPASPAKAVRTMSPLPSTYASANPTSLRRATMRCPSAIASSRSSFWNSVGLVIWCRRLYQGMLTSGGSAKALRKGHPPADVLSSCCSLLLGLRLETDSGVTS